VLIAIIGILIALLLPAVQAAREAARRSQCSNNLKQLALGLHVYHDTYKIFPLPGMLANQLGWNVSILPQIEQTTIAQQMNYNAGSWNMPIKLQLGAVKIQTFLCPSAFASDERSKNSQEAWQNQLCYTIHYYGILGPLGTNPQTNQPFDCANLTEQFGGECRQGVMWQYSSRMADVIDGTSNTYLLGEISWRDMTKYRMWPRGKFQDSRGTLYLVAKNIEFPINSNNETKWNMIAFGSNHPGGAKFAMCDASVRFVSQTIDFGIYLATASRNGSEVVTQQ